MCALPGAILPYYSTDTCTHTGTLPPQRLSSWLERAIETSVGGAETAKGSRIRAKKKTYEHTSPVSVTNCTLEGESGNESCAQYETDYGKNSAS